MAIVDRDAGGFSPQTKEKGRERKGQKTKEEVCLVREAKAKG